MSPFLEIVTDFIASAPGGCIPRKQRRQTLPEGEEASLGAVAAFAGVLAFIFALALLVNAAHPWNFTVNDYMSLIGASVAVALLALGGRWAAVRAPKVTGRNLGLARCG